MRSSRVVQVILFTVVMFLFNACPLSIFAQDHSDGLKRRQASVAAGEVIHGDHFAFGPVVTISGTVNGDLYAFGGQVFIDGRVNGDLLVAGGRISISGTVGQDTRIAGGQITITGNIGRNVTAAGGNVELSPAASIGGGVVATGGNIHLAAPVKGTAKIAAGSLLISNRVGAKVDAAVGSLRITSNAEILGDVNYVSHQDAEVQQGARIQGKLTRNVPPQVAQLTRERIFAFLTGLGLFLLLTSFVSTLILGLLSLSFLPKYHELAVDILKARPGVSLGIGFVAAVVIPAVCALLFALIFTVPVALILLAAFCILLYWGRIFVISRIGEALLATRKRWAFVLGLVLYYMIALIPIVGWLFVLLVILSGLGAELMARKQFYMDARARELL
ncbi:MAG TPA: hypothetical protein VFU31_04000 [Candidatus Binatia bacterium]|nr:hypothetical protein [Candidatus Binatia bacterium]